MQHMSFDPEIAGGIVARIVATVARGLAAGTSASASVTALLPAGADEVSAQFASVFGSQGGHVLALSASAHEELARAGETFAEIARIYSAVDDGCARSFR